MAYTPRLRNAPFITLGSEESMAAERVLAAGTGLTLTDAGANGNVTFSWNGLAIKDNGVAVGTRRGLNLIAGTNVTLTMADDSANDEVDVTIAASGGSLDPFDPVLAMRYG